ncbi:MAG: hypothetical protein GY835_25220 [bacterium]|nr:hypothetical protein [bacterium]
MEPIIGHLSERAHLEGALDDIVAGTTPDPDWFPCPEKDAWYRPLHFHGQEDWGIYIRVKSVERLGMGLARSLEPHLPRLSLARLLAAPLLKLLNHEVYHHLVEGMASRLQAGAPDGPHLVYVNYSHHFYKPTFLSDDCIEEGMANGYALRAFQTANAKHALGHQFAVHACNHFKRCIEDKVHGLPGYRLGGQFMKPDLARKGERVLLDLMMSACYIKPQSVVQGAVWQGSIKNMLSECRYRAPGLGGMLRPLTSLSDVPVYLVVDEHY